jgi:hypothetical protein
LEGVFGQHVHPSQVVGQVDDDDDDDDVIKGEGEEEEEEVILLLLLLLLLLSISWSVDNWLRQQSTAARQHDFHLATPLLPCDPPVNDLTKRLASLASLALAATFNVLSYVSVYAHTVHR